MKYVSVDLETTGLNPKVCQILEIGAVADDTDRPLSEAPTFRRIVLPSDSYHGPSIVSGDIVAFAMNAELIAEIAAAFKAGHGYTVTENLAEEFRMWLSEVGYAFPANKVTFAGKNFGGFDLQFLNKLPNWSRIRHNHRYLDPGSMFITSRDTEPPSTEECLKRIGAVDTTVKHEAIADALGVCRLIRARIGCSVESPPSVAE